MEKKFVARPYAKAIFDLALESNTLDEWLVALKILEDFSKHKEVVTLYDDPTIDNQEVIMLLQMLIKEYANEQQQNFIKLLIENKRLKSLTTISKVYAELVSEHLNSSTVEVISFRKLTDSEKKDISVKLKKKLNIQDVKLNCKVDKGLLGGLIIKIGDHVIDGTIKNKIKQAQKHLLN